MMLRLQRWSIGAVPLNRTSSFPERGPMSVLCRLKMSCPSTACVGARGGETQAQPAVRGRVRPVVPGVRNGLLKAGAPVRVTLPGANCFISWEAGAAMLQHRPA